MTGDRMALKAALEKASDTELLSHMLSFVAEKLMALDVDTLCNASRHERTGARATRLHGRSVRGTPSVLPATLRSRQKLASGRPGRSIARSIMDRPAVVRHLVAVKHAVVPDHVGDPQSVVFEDTMAASRLSAAMR